MLTLLAQTRITNPSIANSLGNITNSAVGGGSALSLMITSLLSVAFGLGGIVFFFMLIRGGYDYMTAGGDKEAVQRGMKRLTTAFIGIVILFSVFAIMLVVETLFGINLRQLEFPTL